MYMVRFASLPFALVTIVTALSFLLGEASPYQKEKDATMLKVNRTGSDQYLVSIVGGEVGHVDIVAVPAKSQEHHKIEVNVRTKDRAGDRGYAFQVTFSNPKSVRVEGVVIQVLQLSGRSFKDTSDGFWELKEGEDVVPGGRPLDRPLELKGVMIWETNGSFIFKESEPSGRTWRRVRAPKVSR